MISNPEFLRNLWLEINVHRMTLLFGALAAIFVVVGLFDPHGFGNIVANVALMIFVIITMIWGSHRTGDALLDELRQRTWDAQRMSALNPWSMTWGKLFGGPIVAWIAGATCLLIYLTSRHGISVEDRLLVVCICILGAILVHALSLIGALVGTRFDKHGKSTLTSWAAMGTLALLWAFFANYFKSTEVVVWYGITYERFDFLLATLGSLAAFVVFGAYRMMSIELLVATRPWAWIAFALYLTVYFGGRTSGSASDLSDIGFMVSGGATYIAAFSLYRDPLTFRRLRHYAQAQRWRRCFEEIPIWMASFALVIIFAVISSFVDFAPPYDFNRYGITTVPLTLFLLRDLAILYYFTFGLTAKRVETSAIISIALVVWLIPSIMESMGLVKLSWLFRPPIWDRPVLSALVLATHCAVAGYLCWRRYQQRITPVS